MKCGLLIGCLLPWCVLTPGLGAGGDGLGEAALGGIDQAGADLTYAVVLVGDAGVDDGPNTRLDHLHNVDSGGTAPEVQDGDFVGVALAHGDLIHLGGVVDGVLHLSTHKLHDGGRGSHTETACSV